MSTPAKEDIIKLRKMTGAGLVDAKNALIKTSGDFEAAAAMLRKAGAISASSTSLRTAREGLIGSYLHPGGRIGVLVEVNCETDFVARTEEFRTLVHELTLQIAATSPRWVSKEDVPKEEIGKRRKIEKDLDNFYQENCLLAAKYVRDETRLVADLVTEVAAKTGENIKVARFTRFALGEDE